MMIFLPISERERVTSRRIASPEHPGLEDAEMIREGQAHKQGDHVVKATVVIVGAGFGGLRAARSLKRAPVNVVLLDRHNYHLFQPLLYQVATAGLEPEAIARPARAVTRRQRNLEVRVTEGTGLDLAGKRVITDNGPVAYDYLILAVGGET